MFSGGIKRDQWHEKGVNLKNKGVNLKQIE